MYQSPSSVPDAVTEAPAPQGLGQIAVIANTASGTNAMDSAAIDRAIDILGRDQARLYYWSPKDSPETVVRKALLDGAQTIVAAGGDGTAMAIAGAALGQACTFGALPLGTFNYFARGLGLPEEPDAAARAMLDCTPHDIRVGTVNGRVFLNNASLGIYPSVLKRRETVYRRWGRHRIMAHWSVIQTFLRFQRPMRLTLYADGQTIERRTPLLFVSRSAFQLERFGLKGGDVISHDGFAVLIGRGDTRLDLFRTAFRLVSQTAEPGRDYEFLPVRSLDVHTERPRGLIAYDGEKARQVAPFRFRMSTQRLTVLLPPEAAREGAA
ncbi:diacylglycerol/lipid kinase family protein [Primorskyibacter sp. 2E107]|uniref:diacylglycerol/lipid kinase family protein n=1 Tax=Primorskyibacter sp. 2E107 TaxID=3403458 RepID=UPI003AF85324